METKIYYKEKEKIINSKRKTEKEKETEKCNLWFSYIFSMNRTLIIF